MRSLPFSTIVLLFFIAAIPVGVVVSIWAAPPIGGAYVDYLFRWLRISFVLLFFCSLIFILFNLWKRKNEIFPFFAIALSIPTVLGILQEKYNTYLYNLPPDLTPRYPRPVEQNVFIQDSLHILKYIKTQKSLSNERSGIVEIEKVKIDTIFYSETGDKVFVSYAKFFKPNDLGNNVDVYYLIGLKREHGNWVLRIPVVNIGGSYDTFKEMKWSVRRILYHRFKFADEFRDEENYFWDAIMNK